MNADLSVAPEIAQLAAPPVPAWREAPVPRTDGRVAGDLADLAATPQRWWDRVRFDPNGPVRVPVPGTAGAWLLVLPPGAAADCDCRQATALAGEAVELPGEAAELAGEAAALPGARAAAGSGPGAPSRPGPAAAGRPLRPGRVLVRGQHGPHRVRASGPGYSVTLHVN